MKYCRIAVLILALPVFFAPGASFAAAQPTASSAAPAKPAKAPLVDINTANEAELAAVPQIGPARAKVIIAGRPYQGKDDLVSKRIVSQSVYEKIRNKIIARQ